MIRFDGRIVQFGFGAVGKSFYEKVSREIRFDENNYYVITRDNSEFEAYVNLGGMVENFVTAEVTRDNFREIFAARLRSGDLLIDFADAVGTRDFCEWCAEQNIMYLNTGETDWPEHWYSIFEENELKNALKAKYAASTTKNRCPIVLQHGNNPGLVSHFTKAAIEYIVRTQFKKDKSLRRLVREGHFGEAARRIGIRMIHVNDIDLQEVTDSREDVMVSPWCVDSFWFEMLSEATVSIGIHEQADSGEEYRLLDYEKGFLEFKELAAQKKCRTYYPGGAFEGFLVPHEETITIAKSLEVREDDRVVYRPTVMFLYSPCACAMNYLSRARVNDYLIPDPAKPADCEEPGKTIIRGYVYPEKAEILYRESIVSGTEYVGVLLMGEGFSPVWVGNRVETSFLYRRRASYWQTPTITPVAMSALAAVCWMLKNRQRGGIFFPDDIEDYGYILKLAEKYISKTIYRTFPKQELEAALQVSSEESRLRDIFVRDRQPAYAE